MLLNTVPLANLQLALCAFERRSVLATTKHLACRARFDQVTVDDLILLEVDLYFVIMLKSRHSWAQVNNPVTVQMEYSMSRWQEASKMHHQATLWS